MPRQSLFIILLGTLLAMAALYGPQPLLPLLARQFDVSEAASAALITWSLMAMAIGPLFMGLLLQRYRPRRLLLACFLGLGFSEVAFASVDGFFWLKAIRFIQGGLISALLAATMTYISATADNLRQVMAYYVGASVIGGLSGRILAGFLSENFSWRVYFALVGVLFIAAALFSLRLATTPGVARKSFSLKRMFSVTGDRLIRKMYALIFLGFFAMTALLNFLPFRLEALDNTLGEASIALFYLGFVVGFLVSTNAPRVSDQLGGPLITVALGIALIVSGFVLALVPSVVTLFLGVTLVTCGFFLQHATIAALLNGYAADRAGDVNSLYVAIYYIGGTAGSYLPGLVYIAHGWTYFVALLLAIMAIGITVARRIQQTRHALL